MKELKVKISIPRDLMKQLGYKKRPKKKEMRRIIIDAVAIYAGLKDGTWRII